MQGKHHPKEVREKISKSLRGKHPSLKSRMKNSDSHKCLWQSPDYIQKQMKARGSCPNRAELHLLESLEDLYPDEWLYVGDGRNAAYIFGGKVPDFVHRTKKLIIELFGDYWHSQEITGVPVEEHIQNRIEHFTNYGYKVLVIWEHDLSNAVSLSNLLKRYMIRISVD